MTNPPVFILSAELAGHEQDVRALATPTTTTKTNSTNPVSLVSASRDRSVRQWTLAKSWKLSREYHGHTHFVNAVVCMPPTELYPHGLCASGSMDRLVLVWNLDPADTSSHPVLTLIGHGDTVCALSYIPETEHLLSASWDKTVRVWHGSRCVQTLEGHTQAVWAVLGFVDGGVETIVTASADRTIKLWRDGKCVRTLDAGHTDVIRGLALLPGKSGFASCSNDGSIRLWSLEGNSVAEMSGHTSFVYALDVIPTTGELISGGEDKTMRVWRDGQCVQTILLPATSIWSVKALANGDIACGSNDGMIRVFSRDPARAAKEETLKVFQDSVSKAAIPANTVGDVDKSRLPGLEALQNPGKKDQDVIMVRNGSSVEAHQWSQATQTWTKLGEVVDAVGSGRKQVWNGREYDYVFDVDIEDGKPPLKLPHNATDNPYMSAQQFIDRNQLPQSYLDQVADFIVKNTKGAATLGQSAGGPADPYTGASRYVAGGSANMASSSVVNPDPFTGSSSYGNAAPATSVVKVIPIAQDDYLSFKSANLAGIQKKIRELSTSGDLALELTPAQEKMLDRVILFLQNPAAPAAKMTSTEWSLAETLLQWPLVTRFPALDLLRMTVIHSVVPLTAHADTFASQVLTWSGLLRSTEKAPDACVMLGLRTVANLFLQSRYRSAVLQEKQVVLDRCREAYKASAENKNIALAYVTILLNFTIAQVWVAQEETFAMDLLAAIVEFAKMDADPENLYRALVGLGNLVFKFASLREAATLLGAKELEGKLVSTGDARFYPLLKEIQAYL